MPVRLKDSPKVQRARLQYAAWLGNTTSLIIVVDNDMYVKQSPSDEEDIRITYTGLPDLVYNGVPDWLYQGNIFYLYKILNDLHQDIYNFHFVIRKDLKDVRILHCVVHGTEISSMEVEKFYQ